MLKQPFSFLNSAVTDVFLKVVWFGLLVSGILLNPLFSYPGRDAGIFMYVGSLILKGKIPYLHVWENKGPLVFYINALGLSLGDGSRWGIWLMEFLFLFGAAWLCYALVNSVMGRIPALISVFILVISAGNVLQGGNYSEEYSILFSCLALWAFVKGTEDPHRNLPGILVGVSLGFNILLRPNNISMQVAVAGGFFVLALMSKDWKLLLRRLALMALGVTMVLAPVLVYFASQDALQEMINVVLVFNYQYSSDTSFTQILHGIADASISIGVVFSVLALIGYLAALFVVIKGFIRRENFPPFLLVLLFGLPIELLLSTLSGRNYLHYFIGWAPYLGVLSAFAVFHFLRGFMVQIEMYKLPILLAFILVTVFSRLDVWKGYGAVLNNLKTGQVEYVDPVAAYIRENTTEQDKVLVWGFRPVINFVSGREAPVSFLPYPLVHVDTPLTNSWAEQFYAQISSDPPKLIVNLIEPADSERIPDLDRSVRREQRIKWRDVVLASNMNETLSFIEENYIKVDTVNGADIYQLRTTLP